MPNPTLREARSHWSRHTRHLLGDRAKAAAKLGVRFAPVDMGERLGGEFISAYLGGEITEFRILFKYDDAGRVFARFW